MAELDVSSVSLDQIFGGISDVAGGIQQAANGISQMFDPDSRRTPQGMGMMSNMNPMMNGGGYPQQQVRPQTYGYGYADGSSPYGNMYSTGNTAIVGISDPGYGIEGGGYMPQNAFDQFQIGGFR